jgi:hypothetical protein
LFSEYYHNLIDNKPAVEAPAKPPVSATLKVAGTSAPTTAPATVVAGTSTTTTTVSAGTQTTVVVPIPPPLPTPISNEIGRVIIEQPLHLNMNVLTLPGTSIAYVTLQNPTIVNSIDLYFDKATLISRFKLRLRIYEARSLDDKLQTRLLYHQCFDEDLSVQLINYGHSPQSEVYKSSSNVLTLRNLKTTAKHLIVETDFSFVTLRLTKKSKDLLQQVNIVPIVKGDAVEGLPVDLTGFTVRNDQEFSKLFRFPEEAKPLVEYNSERMPLLKSTQLEPFLNHYAVYLPQPRYESAKESCNELVGEISSNIMNEELVRAKAAQVNFRNCYGEKGLDFSYTFLILLNKFARQHLLEHFNSPTIGDTLVNLYETFVVYEIGPISEHILGLIVELLEKLPKLESNRFIVRIV